MFEQERYEDSERSRKSSPAAGMSRYQVSGTGDTAEIAADQAADRAVGGGLFRSAEGGASAPFQADLSDADLSGGGIPLPEGLQGSMEQSFGASFSNVRLHTGAGADRASRSIDARAFTRGQDIYFSSGSYDPGTREGQHLIAHELAHVAAGDTGIHRAGNGGNGGGSGGGSGGGTGGGAGGGAGGAGNAQQQQQAEEERKKREEFDNAKTDLQGKTVQADTAKSKLEDTINNWSSYQAVIARLKEPDSSNTVPSRASIEELTQATSGKEGSLVDQIDKSIQRFIRAAQAMNIPMNSPEVKEEVSKARGLKDYLKQNADKLPEAKKAIEFAQQQVAIATNPAANPAKGYSKALTAMLNDPACDQFMKAVRDLKSGTGGGGAGSGGTTGGGTGSGGATGGGAGGGQTESFATVSGRARTAANNDNVDPDGSGWGTALRVTNVVGAGVDAVGSVGSFVGIGADYEEVLHPEKTEQRESDDTDALTSREKAENTATVWGAVTDTTSATLGAATSFIESVQLGKQEKLRREKIKAMTGTDPNNPNAAAKKMHSYNNIDRTAQAASWAGAISAGIGAGNSIWGASAGKDLDETKSTELSVGADSVALFGDVLGLSADSAKADQMRKQDAVAKDSMRTIGEQLEKSIAGRTRQGRILTIEKICQRLKNRRFNAHSKRDGSLTSLIDSALADNTANASGQSGQTGTSPNAANTPAADAIDDKQKGLLTTLKMLEKSRGMAKGATSDSRKSVALDTLGMVGDLFSLGSSISGLANIPLVSTALQTVSAIIGFIGTGFGGYDAVKDLAGKKDRIDDRKKKRNICQAAVEQMAALPELSADQLTQMRLTEQNKMQMPEQTIMNAEQYAAAFSMVKSADVNMVDFLYAIHMGFVDQSPDLGPTGTLEEKLTRMYKAMNV